MDWGPIDKNSPIANPLQKNSGLSGQLPIQSNFNGWQFANLTNRPLFFNRQSFKFDWMRSFGLDWQLVGQADIFCQFGHPGNVLTVNIFLDINYLYLINYSIINKLPFVFRKVINNSTQMWLIVFTRRRMNLFRRQENLSFRSLLDEN